MKLSPYLLIRFIALSVLQGYYLHENTIKIKNLETDLCISDSNLTNCERSLNEYVQALEASYNTAVNMEIIMGVDSPDGFISYKEKCMLAPYVSNLNKHKFECEK